MGSKRFVSAIEMAGLGSLSRMPTSGEPTQFCGGYRCGSPARLKIAFELAAKRRQKGNSVDKANVLEVSQFRW
jgi:hypothetical protein